MLGGAGGGGAAFGEASGDSPNDALWDLDGFHGDEFLQLIQTGHILYLAAELGAVTKATCAHTHI